MRGWEDARMGRCEDAVLTAVCRIRHMGSDACNDSLKFMENSDKNYLFNAIL